MKKFSQFKFHKINEQEIQLGTASSDSSPMSSDANQVTVTVSTDKIIGSTSSTIDSKESDSSVVKFLSKIFESKEMSRVYHLSVKGEEGSHAAHLALQSYYEGVSELVDELVEVYQGQYEVIEEYDVINTSSSKSTDRVEYFTELSSFIKSNRSVFSSEDTHLHNIIDEIVAIVYKTLYKLKYNK